VNFAQTGNPNGKALPRWAAFTNPGRASADRFQAPMILGGIKETPDPDKLKIYDALYARLVAGLKQ
jgi:hypothetical protein